jgi:hypothetical protein
MCENINCIHTHRPVFIAIILPFVLFVVKRWREQQLEVLRPPTLLKIFYQLVRARDGRGRICLAFDMREEHE